MAAKKKAKAGPGIVAKARKALAFARQRAAEVQYQMDLSNALFAPGGLAMELFPTEADRTAFLKTDEYKQIRMLLRRLPYPPPTETITIRIPPSENGKSKKRRP
jgi:hypothetical protein